MCLPCCLDVHTQLDTCHWSVCVLLIWWHPYGTHACLRAVQTWARHIVRRQDVTRKTRNVTHTYKYLYTSSILDKYRYIIRISLYKLNTITVQALFRRFTHSGDFQSITLITLILCARPSPRRIPPRISAPWPSSLLPLRRLRSAYIYIYIYIYMYICHKCMHPLVHLTLAHLHTHD